MRYFEQLSISDLKSKVLAAQRKFVIAHSDKANTWTETELEEDWDTSDYYKLNNKLNNDARKIFMDHSQVSIETFLLLPNLLGYNMLGEFSFLGLLSGDPSKLPIYWLIYWDGKMLRAYVPEKGNAANGAGYFGFYNTINKIYNSLPEEWDDEVVAIKEKYNLNSLEEAYLNKHLFYNRDEIVKDITERIIKRK